MRRLHYVLVLPVLAACASAPRAPAEPLAWPPGEYYLEATVTYAGGTGQRRDLYSADLYIGGDQSLRMDSHFSTCLEPTPAELERDARRGVRTFRCGEALVELRPQSTTVIGTLQIVVQEEYLEEVCIQRNANGVCTQTISTIRTRPVRKRARFRVREY
jgi:hypothetical protein